MTTLISGRETFPRNSWSGTITEPSNIKGLCLIIDQDLLRTPAPQAMKAALSAGVRFFQYRNKRGSRKTIYETSLQLASLARTAGARFIVNDHADIAAAVNADGVHLGQDDLPVEYARKLLGVEKIIGVSTHTREEARAAEAGGADYIGFGPIFPTATKDAGRVQGTEELALIKKMVVIPVVAIGGINQTNIREAINAGADGVAVISAILCAGDIGAAAGKMMALIQS